MRRTLLVILALLLIATAGCDRTGLSRPFREAAEHALEQLRIAEASNDPAAVDRAEKAIADAKAKKDTRADWQLVDVLDWYAMLVHRRDRARTLAWRQICSKEVELYFAGEQTGMARIGSSDVVVARGACQRAAFDMMAEDCRQWGGTPAECAAQAAGGASPGGTSGR